MPIKGGFRDKFRFATDYFRRISIKAPIVIGFFLAIVLVVTVLVVTQIKQHILKETNSQLESSLGTLIDALELWRLQNEQYIVSLSFQPEVIQFTQTLLELDPKVIRNHPVSEKIADYFKPKMLERDDIGIFIISRDFINLADFPFQQIGETNVIAFHRTNLLTRVLTGETLLVPAIQSEVPLPDMRGRLLPRYPTMFFVTPIRDEEFEVIAALAIRIDLDGYFSRIIKLGWQGLGKGSYGVDQQGILVTPIRDHQQLLETNFFKEQEIQPATFRLADPGGDIMNGFVPKPLSNEWPLIEPAEQQEYPPRNLRSYRNYRGVGVFGKWKRNTELGFNLVVEVEKQAALQVYLRIRNFVILLILGVVLLSLFLAFSMYRIRKAADRILKTSETKLAAIVDSAQDAIITINESGAIQSFNPAAEQIFGWRKNEAIGKNVKILMPTGYQKLHDDFIQSYLDTGIRKIPNAGRELLGMNKAGRVFPIHLFITETRLEGYRLFTGFIEEISVRKIMEQELTNSQRQLEDLLEARTEEKELAEKANRAKSEFLANMSHELRTPLNAILGYTQLLLKNESIMNAQPRPIQTIHQSAEHLLQMISELLDLAKIEARKLELQISEFSLLQFLQAVADIIQVDSKRKGLEFHCQFGAELPVYVFSDKKRLRQVLLNLLNNAVKFTPTGGVEFCVRTKKFDERNNQCIIYFEVRDTGIGIDPGEIEKIFEAFYQSGKLNDRTKGTGLGLKISQVLIQLMGGELQVQSQPGKGSIFNFELSLPIGNHQQITKNPEEYQKILGYRQNRQKILIVDDMTTNRLTLMDLLQPLGFDLMEAENGETAIEKVLQWKPDLMLLDLKMPGMDGRDAARQLRTLYRQDQLIIIAVSANVYDQIREDCIQAGCNDFLPKPVNIRDLLDALQHYLDLDWVIDHEPKPEEDASPLVFPPWPILRKLLHSAELGHPQGIKNQLRDLSSQADGFPKFRATVTRYLENYEFEKIIQLIQTQFQDGGEHAAPGSD